MENVKILVIEDEVIVALDIKNGLESLGYLVTDIASSYEEAFESYESNKPDLILTDIHLEESKNGIEVAKDIQRMDAVPIIFLTAFADDTTMNEAVKVNPVGYLLKPFNLDELKSTILLGLHKAKNTPYEITDKYSQHLGYDFYFDHRKELLYYKNHLIKLSQKEKILLSTLIQARGNIVPNESLEHLIWPENVSSESSLRTLVYRLRTKLDYKFIETIPSLGIKL